MSTPSNVVAQTDRHTHRLSDRLSDTDRQIDTHNKNITYIAYAGGNNVKLYRALY